MKACVEGNKDMYVEGMLRCRGKGILKSCFDVIFRMMLRMLKTLRVYQGHFRKKNFMGGGGVI